MPARAAITLLGMAVLAAAAVALRLLIGNPTHPFGWPDRSDILNLRLDHVIAGATVGAALGSGGVLLQSLLKNPLASPDLIGAASGAGLAVMLSIFLADQGGSDTVGNMMALHSAAALA